MRGKEWGAEPKEEREREHRVDQREVGGEGKTQQTREKNEKGGRRRAPPSHPHLPVRRPRGPASPSPALAPLLTHRRGCWQWSAAPGGKSGPPASCGSRSAAPRPARHPAESTCGPLSGHSDLHPTGQGSRPQTPQAGTSHHAPRVPAEPALSQASPKSGPPSPRAQRGPTPHGHGPRKRACLEPRCKALGQPG